MTRDEWPPTDLLLSRASENHHTVFVTVIFRCHPSLIARRDESVGRLLNGTLDTVIFNSVHYLGNSVSVLSQCTTRKVRCISQMTELKSYL